MDFGPQIVSLCIIFVVVIEFYQYRRLQIFSVKLFQYFLALAMGAMASDIVCSYAVHHPESFSILFNKIVHQVYLLLIAVISLYTYIYLDFKGRKRKSYSSIGWALRVVPFIISVFGIFFGDINYYVSDEGNYIYGSMVQVVTYMLCLYGIMTLHSMFTSFKLNRLKLNYDFFFCLLVWLAVAFYQLAFPTANISGLAIALMVLFIYLSFENSKEYQDKEIPSLLSKQAFEMTLAEHVGEKHRFWVVYFSLQNIKSLRSTYSQADCLESIDLSVRSIPDFKKRNIFRITDYSFGFIIFTKEHLDDWVSRYKISEKALVLENSPIQPVYFACSIECPEHARNFDDLVNLMNFCKSNYEAQTDHSILQVDKEIASKRNYLQNVEKLVQTAIDEDGFYVVYQPIINTKTGRCDSAEALVRLKDSTTYGFISPEVFIPIAERCGLISKLGEIVLNHVCRFIKENDVQKIGLKYIEVNLSGIQIADPNIAYTVHNTIKSHGLTPDMINLEITETAISRQGKIALQNMEQLKKFGYKFSMDDFGTGYSNFSQIVAVRYDLIKLDKSLVWPAFEEGNKQANTIMHACINMMLNLGMGIVAEGVETEEQAAELREAGVEHLQGFYFSKPIPEEPFLKYVKDFNKVYLEGQA